MKVQAIIPAAGTGERLGSSIPKPLIKIEGKELIAYSLAVFENCSLISSVIIATQSDLIGPIKALIESSSFTKVKAVLLGGATRRESVSNALKMIDDDTDVVLVHDAARPFLNETIIKDSIAKLEDFDGVVAGVPCKSTIKEVDAKTDKVLQTFDRSRLWEIQTPQVFKKDILLKAHNDYKGGLETDDAAMVESIGANVGVSMGSYKNIKITTQEDVVMAEGFIKNET